MSERRRDLSGPEQGLTHNPFAALRKGGDAAPAAEPGSESGREPEADEPEPSEDPLVARLRLVRERAGRKGKTITRIVGLAGEGSEQVARDLAKALGCGWSREEDEYLLQGNQVDRAADWLEARGARSVSRSH